MKNKKILNIGLIGCGVIGLRRIDNLPNYFRLIGCADPKIHIMKNFKKKKLVLTSKLEKISKFKKFRCSHNCNNASIPYSNYFRMH